MTRLRSLFERRNRIGGKAMRRLPIILATAAALMLAGPPAGAIINGQEDTTHLNVGVMLLSQGDGYNPGLFCSGALLSTRATNPEATHPAVFLTAGHCVAALEYQLPADTQVVVSFDSDLNLGPDGLLHPTHVIEVSGWNLIPSYFSHGANHRDVGVLFLSAAPDGLRPVLLPTPGSDEDLVGQQLTEVGYGVDSLDRGFNSPNANFTIPGQRLTGTEKVSAVTPSGSSPTPTPTPPATATPADRSSPTATWCPSPATATPHAEASAASSAWT